MMSAVDIQVAGDIQININSGQIVAMWIDGKPVANNSATVAKGKAIITIEVATQNLKQPLELEVKATQGSLAKFKIINE